MSFKICNVEGCNNLVEGRTEMCATHNHEQRKADRDAAKVQIVKPINKITPQRAKETQEYNKLRKEYLESFMQCEIINCTNRSEEIHHLQGKDGYLLTDTNNFLAVCGGCHRKIHANPNWARENMYTRVRSTNQKTRI